MSDELVHAIRAHRTARLEQILRRGRGGEPPEALFPQRLRSGKSGYEDETQFGHRFNRIGDRAEVTRGIHPFHRLRHTFCTRLPSSGVEPYLVSKWAGHHSTTFTERVYGTWVPNREDRNKLNDAMLSMGSGTNKAPKWHRRDPGESGE